MCISRWPQWKLKNRGSSRLSVQLWSLPDPPQNARAPIGLCLISLCGKWGKRVCTALLSDALFRFQADIFLRLRVSRFSQNSPSLSPCVDKTPKDILRVTLTAPHSGNTPNHVDLSAWFEPLDIRRDGDDLHVTFPHAFFPAWFNRQGKQSLEQAARQLWGNVRFLYAVRSAGTDAVFPLPLKKITGPTAEKKEEPTAPFPTPLASFPSGPDSIPGFDAFFCGSKNQLTLNVLRETASGGTQYIPLLLRGPSGTGKTMLLRASASALAGQPSRPSGDALYLTAPDFAALFRGSEKEKDGIRRMLRSCAALCVDDVHLLAEQTDAQAELAALIDVLTPLRRPVLCTALTAPDGRTDDASPPAALSPALFSRLCMGMVLDLAEPDLDVRLRYAQSKLEEQGLEAGRDTPLLLARRCTKLRHMQGAILRMRAFQAQSGRLPDESDMDTILRSSGNPAALTPEAVVALVAGRCGYAAKDLRSRKRDPKLVMARQIAMYLCRELLGESYPALGRMFGGKDHSTVMHAVKKIREIQVGNKDMHILVTELTQSCRKYLS